MKEVWKQTLILRQSSVSTLRGLTNPSQTPYSKGGDIFMEGKPDMPPNSQPTGPEHAEKTQAPKLGVERPVSAERQTAARRVWEEFDKGRVLSVDERRTREEIIKKGIPPIAGGVQEPSQEQEQPVAGGAAGVPPDGEIKPPPVQAVGAGGAGGGGRPTATAEATPEEPNNQGENHSAEGEQPSVTDRTAANLIAKFRQEHGENDPAKIQQLRIDLSGRIQQLERERDELGAREGSITPEGELTSAAAEAINAIDNRIRELQSFIADVFPTPENQDEDITTRKLLVETDKFVNGLLKRGLKRNQINDLSNLTKSERATRAKLVHDIKEFIEDQPSIETGHFPSNILLAVRNFTELREELISEIIFKSFTDKSETNEYEVGLYAASNLDILLGFLSKDDNERYKELFTLRTAARFFQTMNATIIKGTFDSFGHSAENINYQHFEKMRDIRGSGLAMRLFEQGYKDLLAEDKRVLQDKIDGLKEKVANEFREINEAGEIRSEFADYRDDSKMKEWEVERALNVGRTFLNVTLRAAESIATGQVPSDRRRYTSPPQEDMVRILNWNQWLLGRFTVGGNESGRHGEEFLKMSTDRWEKFLRYKGAKLNMNKIIEFGGVDVRKMEEGGQYRTSGVYSSWRMENAAFDEVYFNLNGNRISVQHFMDKELITKDLLERLKKEKVDMVNFLGKEKLEKGEVTILDAVKAFKKSVEKRGERNPSVDPAEIVTEQDQKEYKNILMPVVDNLNYGLSMLLKNPDFGAQDNKLGYLLREAIWEKIAKTNIPLMIDYLTGIKYATEKDQKEILGDPKAVKESEIEKAKSIEALRGERTQVAIGPLQWEREDVWNAFRKKVLIRHERMIRKGMGEEVSVIRENEFNETEKQLITAIQEQGVKLAPHLADIVFPYTPFMNDMPFEKFNYAKLGQTFYKRRSTNDLGGFNKGQQAYAKIMTNPGGIPMKEAVAAMGEIIAGVESPEGPRPAIESNFPTFSALLDTVTTEPWKRQAMFKMLLEFTRKETSLAQRWAGIKADSLIESEAANLIDETTRAGILTPELARYLKKEKGLTLVGILWMLFRDIIMLSPAILATEFGSELIKTGKQ